jgi:DNA-binding PadR family transcriptional regulator
VDLKAVNREILLAFWKVHILHHANEGPVVGQWMLRELAHHGYEVSPGTLYPMLKRMEGNGWLRSQVAEGRGPHARREYRLTNKGREVLQLVRKQIRELGGEVFATEVGAD